MKKLLGLLAATGLVASTGATVVACGDPAGVTQLGTVEIKTGQLSGQVKDIKIDAFVTGKTSLVITSDKTTSSLVEATSTDLAAGTLKSTVTVKLKAETLPTAATKEVLTVKYNDVVLGEIKVSIAKADGTTPAEKVALSTVVTVTDLGAFDSAPNAAAVLTKVKALNANLKETEVEVTEVTTTGANVKVLSTSTSYVAGGTVAVKFTVKVALNSVVTVTQLGAFGSAPNAATVLAKVKELNANLKETEVEVTDITGTTANVKVLSTSTSYVAGGTVAVSFTVS